jgi:hypothetical protein
VLTILVNVCETPADVDLDFLEAYERIYELTAVRCGKVPPSSMR